MPTSVRPNSYVIGGNHQQLTTSLPWFYPNNTGWNPIGDAYSTITVNDIIGISTKVWDGSFGVTTKSFYSYYYGAGAGNVHFCTSSDTKCVLHVKILAQNLGE